MDKRQLRKDIKARVGQLNDETKTLEAKNVFEHIEGLDLFAKSNNIMIFSSLPDEIPTHEVIKKWAKQKNVFLPRVNGDDLEIVKFNPDFIKCGSYNIMEPTGNETISPKLLDLIIVPGVAFDRCGNRCGRGKGFYDRFLARTDATTIAVCFDCQLVEGLPTEPHDIKIQHVITKSFKTI